ncbi:MAG TPA: zinc-ribbon domain containing protein [Dehalococcoidia bacterium]
MQFVDQTLTCVACGSAFTFTASEQEFHAQKGFSHPPKRCPRCRQERRARRDGGSAAGRELYPAVCVACGSETQVPFLPRGNRPVYCSGCYGRLRAMARDA